MSGFDRSDDAEVLVVGAGPAGLAVAATLAGVGVATLIVDRRTSPSTLPRATALSTRSMELMRRWGVDAEVAAGAVDAEVMLWETDTLASVADGRAQSVGYPTRDQAAVLSPCAPTVVPQDWVEDVLLRHLRSSPAVRLEPGVEVVAVDVGPVGVRATVVDVDGTRRTIEARHLVAADGAHSAVRDLLGIEVEDFAGTYDGVQVVLRAPLSQLVGPHRYALYSVTTEASPGLFLPAGRDDRWVYGSAVAPDDPRSPGTDPVLLETAVRLGAGVPELDVHIERIGAFRSRGQLARQFRLGSAFLVGDAAHRVTPRGGTGLNTALHSGHDLGWKLAWVSRGWAGDALLDTYEAERRIVAAHNVARSIDPNGSRRHAADELPVDLGGRISHTWVRTSTGRVSSLDLVGTGWTVFVGPDHRGAPPAPSGAAPTTVHGLDPLAARALGIASDGALVVRPDGVPVDRIGPSAARTEVAA
jgi:2-polyprenyl-6-methoxyphenol hydroxylase-like FAD-dependent oxidoreductase